MHICISKLTIIGSDNGLLPGRRQAIISTNAGILLIGPLGTNFSDIVIWIQIFSFKKMHFKMSQLCTNKFAFILGIISLKSYFRQSLTMSPFRLWSPLHYLSHPTSHFQVNIIPQGPRRVWSHIDGLVQKTTSSRQVLLVRVLWGPTKTNIVETSKEAVLAPRECCHWCAMKGNPNYKLIIFL